DRSATSAYRGSVHVSWFDRTPSVRVATSSDGGRAFAPPAVLETWASAFRHQVAVRPDGSVHVVWCLGGVPGVPGAQMWPPRDDAPSEAWTAVYHACSNDGGTSWSEPAAVAFHAGQGMVGIPSFASDRDGCLLWVFGQAETLPDHDARPLVQPRHRLHGIRSEDGTDWSAPQLLCPDVPATTHIGLPALASDGESWWVLAYLADDEGTRVALLRSDDAGRSFALDRTLATRAFAIDEINLGSSYWLNFCDDVAQPGHYVGIA